MESIRLEGQLYSQLPNIILTVPNGNITSSQVLLVSGSSPSPTIPSISSWAVPSPPATMTLMGSLVVFWREAISFPIRPASLGAFVVYDVYCNSSRSNKGMTLSSTTMVSARAYPAKSLPVLTLWSFTVSCRWVDYYMVHLGRLAVSQSLMDVWMPNRLDMVHLNRVGSPVGHQFTFDAPVFESHDKNGRVDIHLTCTSSTSDTYTFLIHQSRLKSTLEVPIDMPRIVADNATCAICIDSLFTKLDDLDQLVPVCAPDCGTSNTVVIMEPG